MEKPRHNKKPKIYEVGVQREIEKNRNLDKRNSDLIKEIFALIKKNSDTLEDKISYLNSLETQKSSTEFNDEIESVKKLIKAYKSSIEDLKIELKKAHQNKIFNDKTYEKWNKIQDDYNKILLSIDDVRLN